MTMEPPWGPGWFLISEAPYRPRAPHQSPWDSSTGWNQPCRSRPCLIKGGCDNGCIGISLGTQWLFKINLIKSHDGLTIQISKWWYIWYVHGILVVLRGFSIHIWWGSTISGCERIVDCTGRVDLTQLLACCSQKGYALTANFMEHLPWFIDTFPSIYIYINGITSFRYTYIYIHAHVKSTPIHVRMAHLGYFNPVNTLCNCVWYYHIYYERQNIQYQTTY